MGFLTPLPYDQIVNRVKHLNPRQGITIGMLNGGQLAEVRTTRCETPKSPPGDYNHRHSSNQFAFAHDDVCETPKSPPGDYNELCLTPTKKGFSTV